MKRGKKRKERETENQGREGGREGGKKERISKKDKEMTPYPVSLRQHPHPSS